MPTWNIRLLETPEDMAAVEALQREVWPGSETDVVRSSCGTLIGNVTQGIRTHITKFVGIRRRADTK